MSITREEAIVRLQDTHDRMKQTVDFAKRNGLTPPNLNKDIEAYAMAIDALREQEKKDQHPQQPLTMDELRKMDGETVYCLELNIEMLVLAQNIGWITVTPDRPLEYERYKAHGLTLYRTRPKEKTT